MRYGIDLGGTKTEIIALSETGEEIFRTRKPTPRGDYGSILRNIADLVAEADQKTGETGTVGVGIPGVISQTAG